MGRKGEPNFWRLCPMCGQKFRQPMPCIHCGSKKTRRTGVIQNSNGVQMQRYGCYACRLTFRMPIKDIYLRE